MALRPAPGIPIKLAVAADPVERMEGCMGKQGEGELEAKNT